MDGFHPSLSYSPIEFDTTPLETGFSQCLPQVDLQYQTMLDLRKKVFETENNDEVSEVTTEATREILEIKSSIQKAKCLYEHLAFEFIDATENAEEAQTYLNKFTSNISTTASLENQVTNCVRLPEHIRELFMQHMSLLKPIEKEITTELEQHISSLAEKKTMSTTSIKALSDVFHTVQSLSGYRTCPVCLSREISHYLVPCGHTFCTTCLDKHRGACFLCRKQITTYHRLYFS
jgi:hypothetical protein